MSLVSFFASQLGIFSLKIGKNHRFLALGTGRFFGTSYIRKKNAELQGQGHRVKNNGTHGKVLSQGIFM